MAAGRIVFSPRLLLGKHPGASMSITCLTQITCSLQHQSREEKALCNSLERWEGEIFFLLAVLKFG